MTQYLFRLLLTMTFLMICHHSGYSLTIHNALLNEESLTHRDSMIQEMADFIQKDYKPTKATRRHIEKRIKDFPHSILRRDTLTYFLNTAYAVAYYEFCKHDYKRAKSWIDEFDKKAMPSGLFASYFHYSSVGFNALTSINSKGKFKSKKDKNSWLQPINLSITDSVNFNFKRIPGHFIDSFLDDVPMDCAVSTYDKLLTLFKKEGGHLEWLNGYSKKGFVQRCLDAKRNDILEIVYRLWNVTRDDFSIGNWGYLEYVSKAIKVDTTAISKMKYEILSFDPQYNISQIDSLITINEIDNIERRIIHLLNLYYNRSQFSNIINICQKYNTYLSSSDLSTLHNYWALASSYLGRYEEALSHFEISLSNSDNQNSLTTIKLNKGCTLGEMGQMEEAVAIFMNEKDKQMKPFERFTWNDNLGYIYSFYEPGTALFYYNEAEKFLDNSTLYKERKIRHFCRKAQVLNHNKFLQRQAIDEAMKLTLVDGCPDVAKGVAYTELAVYTMSSFDYYTAERYYLLASDFLSVLSLEDTRRAYLNLNHAQNLCSLGRPEDAVELLIKQLETQSVIYDSNHPEYAKTLSLLLKIECEYNITRLPVDNLYDSLCITRKNNNHRSVLYEDILTDIAYYSHKDQWDTVLNIIFSAIELPFNPMQRLVLFQIYESVTRDHTTAEEYNKLLSALLPKIKTEIIKGLLLLAGDEQRAMQLPIDNIFKGTLKAKCYETALELSLFRKGLLFATRNAIEKQMTTNRKTRTQFQSLITLREELNAAIAYNDTTHIPNLSASVAQLQRNLNQKVCANEDVFSTINKTISQVTAGLRSEDCAIEFIKYCEVETIYYGAFIIGKDGLEEYVELGTENDLKNNPQKIWKPLEEITSCSGDIYFCPDGLLHNMGIEFISHRGGKPMSHLHNLHRVFHLSALKSPYTIGNNIVAIGISDYNSPVGEGEVIDRGSWTDLPNVKYELQQISKKLAHFNPRIFFNDEAMESEFKKLSGSNITTLHISTHGFSRDFQRLINAATDTTDNDHNIAQRMLTSGKNNLSGLLFRQGNLSWCVKQILDAEDDLLTTEEIEMLSFPNLNLTVLSACDTGLGEIDSEGVWGLQRAFRIAGSKSLICSLSKVDDYWSAQFMSTFYEYAAQGNTIYDSFHMAQQWLYHELPDNPEIWSAFILIE